MIPTRSQQTKAKRWFFINRAITLTSGYRFKMTNIEPLSPKQNALWKKRLGALAKQYAEHPLRSVFCGNVAVAIARLAREEGVKDVGFCLIVQTDKRLSISGTSDSAQYAYMSAYFNGEAVDIDGGDADVRWENRWDDANAHFIYSEISQVESVSAACQKHGLAFNESSQTSYYDHLAVIC